MNAMLFIIGGLLFPCLRALGEGVEHSDVGPAEASDGGIGRLRGPTTLTTRFNAQNSSTSVTITTTTSSKYQDNCQIDGPCDCSDLEKGSDKYYQCITNPNCEHCFTNGSTLTPSTTTTMASRTKTRKRSKTSGSGHSASSSAFPAKGTSTLASMATATDNCWIDGPCDCSKLDKNSDQWFHCVTDPDCDHCWEGGSTLTPRSSTGSPSSYTGRDESNIVEYAASYSGFLSSVAMVAEAELMLTSLSALQGASVKAPSATSANEENDMG